MAYTPELKQLMQAVERTRPQRIEQKRRGKEFSALSMEAREERLKYHPDYREDSRRPIHVGPSKGYAISPEIVDLIEARSRVDPDRVDLSKVDYETDVLILGGGGAGTAAALLAQEAGASVLIATKLRHGDANTMMAEGGIQAASKESDSPYYHYLDVVGGGHFVNTPELVSTLVAEAPGAIEWLERLGTMFAKHPDGRLRTLHGGGTSRKRMHYAADITGAEIMRTLRDEAKNRAESIRTIEFSPAVELVLNEHGHCAGAVLYNMETEEYRVVRAKATILATGGSGRLHMQGFMTTNHYGATGDGLILAYRAGVKLCFLHTVQYHPTGVVFPEQAEGLLITEKFRGAGAHLLNRDGEQFVYEREPRDVETASIIRECGELDRGVCTPTGRQGVWLDAPMIDLLEGEGTVQREFPGKDILYKRYGIDISKEPMLVSPTLHYQNGGLEYTARGETSVPGLFAAGEVTGGVHGENRLMGNSLLDVIVFGRIAGTNAAQYALEQAREGALTLDHVRRYHQQLDEAGVETDRLAPMLLPDYTPPDMQGRRLPQRVWPR